MNADILKRLMRAIASGSTEDAERVARKMIDAEREVGHAKLASSLQSILDRPRKTHTTPHDVAPHSGRSLTELPLSRRHGQMLATLIPRETLEHHILEHHMVLPPDVEARFARIEREYAARERLGVYGLRPRKTVLLYGPPGCGKSLGAKRLAWNTGLPLMKVRFDALLSSYFGESATNLRAVFDAARDRPCVLLLDECDFIARSRTQARDIGEAARIVNSLLTLMEEYDAPGLLVATTNVESSLDEALFRRFDEVLHVPPPGHDEILKLLRWSLSAVQVSEHVDWGQLVRTLAGQPAATVVKVAQDAAKEAVLGGQRIISAALLENVIADLHRHGNQPAEMPSPASDERDDARADA